MSARVALTVAGLAALALPLPAFTILGVGVTGAGLAALGIAVARPGSTAPAVLIAAAVVSWLVTPDGYGRPERLAALGLAVAVVHSSAALAAVVPPRSRVAGRLLLRWGLRTLAAAAAGTAVVAATGLPAGTVPPVPVTVTALAAVTVAVAVVREAVRAAAADHGADPSSPEAGPGAVSRTRRSA